MREHFLIYKIFIVLIICLGIFFTFKHYEHYNEMKIISRNEIRGFVLVSKEKGRGFYYLVINDYVSNTKLNLTLPGSWIFTENNIQAKDSVSKEANSRIINFYKVKRGKYQKCCNYEIDL